MTPFGGSPTPDRSVALDVFRGASIAGMILVSNPAGGASYAPLEHAAWNGFTPTDLVFPSFAFIVGISLVYSLAARHGRPGWRGLSLFDRILPVLLVIKYIQKLAAQTGTFHHAPDPALGGYDLFFLALGVLLIVLPQLERRAAARGDSATMRVIHHGVLLFALGLIWEFNADNPGGFRVLAVLQRLGIVYLLTGLVILYTSRRAQLAWAVGLLALYWIVMKTVPVPGYGAGVLTMEGNLAGYLDRLIIGRAHMYLPDAGWDPEGLLGAIPTTVTALLGAIAGGWVRTERPITSKVRWLLVVGIALTLAGLGANPLFPINKNLWSPSFVLFTGGLDCILLGAAVWLIDLKGVRAIFYPFMALGANAILLYLLSGTVMHYVGEIPAGAISLKDAIYQRGFASWLNPFNASLGMAVANFAAWIGVAIVLYRKKIFVKI